MPDMRAHLMSATSPDFAETSRAPGQKVRLARYHKLPGIAFTLTPTTWCDFVAMDVVDPRRLADTECVPFAFHWLFQASLHETVK